jgi:GT2 family glycosyltransferase
VQLTIIIPVFNAFEELKTCLESVSDTSSGLDVVLINDASTDSRIQPLLEAWTRNVAGRTLLDNDGNQGFVYSVNRGISSVTGDVILLNSDTIVTPGWHQALYACLASDSEIATATPWSNNGEIVSFPEFCKALSIPDNLAETARAIASVAPPLYPEIPTAVGFCMAISRLAIEQVGLFDEVTFGRGYGEENDFSMRATLAGMKNVLCDNAYVAHHGGSSFVPLGLQPGQDSMNRMLGKHPGYLALVEDFIRTDPLSSRRQELIDAVQRRRAGMR